MYPLRLTAIPGNWQLFMKRKNDPSFVKVRNKIFARDNYICQFCGFQAQEYQEVVNLDNNYHKNTSGNMVTACVFCTQCLFVESIGLDDYGGGTIVYLPEISQTELNSFCHVIFCAMANGTSYENDAQALYRGIKIRSHQVDEYFGTGCSEPSVLGRLIADYQARTKKDCQELFKDLRLLPSRARFKVQIEHWAASALKEISTED